MSPTIPKPGAGNAEHAAVFAALGDPTRLVLLGRLSDGEPKSIAELTTGSSLTRQAVTKHLRVLERVRVVHGRRSGRETLFELDARRLAEARAFLEAMSKRWDDALERLRAHLEEE